jgi:acyl-CoA thioesterase
MFAADSSSAATLGGARGESDGLDVLALARAGANTWSARLQPGWMALGGIHGGLVVAALLRAAAEAAGRRPATITAHLHAPVAAGVVELQAEVLRAGRSAASVSVLARQAKLCASALVLLDGAEARSCGADLQSLGEPMPASAPEQTPPLQLPGGGVPFGAHVEIRPTGESRPLAAGAEPVLRAWIRPRRAIEDPVTRAAILLDALAPSLWAVWRAPLPVPTIELSLHFAPPALATAWSAIAQRTVWANDAYCVDEAELRNEDGALIAQARQRRKLLKQVAQPPAE